MLGHESSGMVVEVGKAVKDVKVGDRGIGPAKTIEILS